MCIIDMFRIADAHWNKIMSMCLLFLTLFEVTCGSTSTHCKSGHQSQSESSEKCRFLSPIETNSLSDLQAETGKFSYYVLSDGKIIILPEAEVEEHKKELLEHRIQQITANKFKVTVTNSPFKGEFCTHRIGATMHTGDRHETVGMYVSYNGALYFLSSAHNFVLTQNTPDIQLGKGILTNGRMALFDVKGMRIPVGPVYYVFSTHCTSENKGRKIIHTADISISQAPTFTHLMEIGKPQFMESIQDGQDSCRDCSRSIEDCELRHRRDLDPCQYKILDFYKYNQECGGQVNEEQHEEQHLRYCDRKLLEDDEAWIRCRPSGRTVLTGKVISFDNRLILHHTQGREFQAYNVLLIQPESNDESKGPKEGDSGSVWVLGETSEAVAITVGMGRLSNNKWAWAAAPLKPLLDELCFAFSDVFLDPSMIKPARYLPACSNPPAGVRALPLSSSTPNFTSSRPGQLTTRDSAYDTATRHSRQAEEQ